MTVRHSALVSSLGSLRPELDRQWMHARLQAYVNSHVRHIGEFRPCSNRSVRGTVRLPAGPVSPPAVVPNAGGETGWAVRLGSGGRATGTIIWELARVASARWYRGTSGSGIPAAWHAARAVGWAARLSSTRRRVGVLRKERDRVLKW